MVEARKLRAQTIIDEEALMSDADRANPKYFPQYLQVLQATETKEEVWAGLSGKMVSEIMKVEEQVSAAESGLKRQFQEELRKVQENLQEKMAAEAKKAQDEMQEQMKQAQDEMAAEMRQGQEQAAAETVELKAMVAQLLAQTMEPEPGPEPEPEARP